ncbi:phosphate transport system permease protein PstA [Actinomadura sp. NBRC 104412]|uniref:phosphate ABC transporter permease PstA n=1 Tax=Actinomadura sp. NBRC 104412 TaxID=3032203 RepID=UPI00249FC617|nr:phosphate ABC transporter permease PstA [Actinomadura sp. NBRC 104412]GLZ05259.1 phosphate transport system permease protein PstA [Actinomadura sp. NBRC 104412]
MTTTSDAPRTEGAAARPGSAGAAGGAGRPPRRRMSGLTRGELAVLGGCGLSSFLFVWLILARLTDGIGRLGWLVAWYAVFLAMVYVVTWDTLGRKAAADRVAATIIRTGILTLILPLGFLLVYVLVEGLPALRPGFFTDDLSGVTPEMPASAGGGLHAIVGTLEQLTLALLWTVPLSVLTAIFLNETRSRFRRPLRILVDAMSGVPSIVAGLFVYAALIIPLGTGFNGFSAGIALSIVMIPTVTRTVEVVLRLVPNGLREASLALGASRARTVWSVVLPTARSGVTTAVVLGIARTVGETAPLLFTSFGLDLLNANPLKDPQESLPLFVYSNVQKPSETAAQRGFTGALVLITVVLALFAVARFIGRGRRSGGRPRGMRRPAKPQKGTQ